MFPTPPQLMWDLTIHILREPTSLLALVSLSNRCGISQSTPLRGPTSSLALVPLSNRCGISQSTPLRGLASSLALVPLSNRYRISQSTPLQGPASLMAHHPVSTTLRSSASSLAHRSVSSSGTICNNPSPPLFSLNFSFRASPQGFKTRLLGRGFHTLIKNVLFSSSTDVGSHRMRPYFVYHLNYNQELLSIMMYESTKSIYTYKDIYPWSPS